MQSANVINGNIIDIKQHLSMSKHKIFFVLSFLILLMISINICADSMHTHDITCNNILAKKDNIFDILFSEVKTQDIIELISYFPANRLIKLTPEVVISGL